MEVSETRDSISQSMAQYMASAQQINIVQQFLDPKPVLDEIYQFLRCGEYQVDENGVVVWKQHGQPLINTNGIPVFMALIKSHINQSTVQANMKEMQITCIMKELNIDVIELIASRWKEYEIQKQHFNVIVDIVDHHVETFLSRTLDDGERERFKMPGIKIENPQIQENKQGLI